MNNIAIECEELSRETVFEMFSRKIEKVMFKLPDGKEKDYYIKKERQAVCILPLTADNKVILVEQYRSGPKKVFLELPGGYMEDGEDPMTSSKRELLEETGYKGNLKLVTTCFEDAYVTMERIGVIATNCKKIANQDLDSTEFINVKEVTINTFREILRSGKMTDVEVGYLGLGFLNLL